MQYKISLLILFIVMAPTTDASTRDNKRFDTTPQVNNKGDNKLWGGPEAWVESLSFMKSSETDNEVPTNAISKTTFASGIAFLTGVAAVFCFRLNKCYANKMTGIMVKAATAIGEIQGIDALFFIGVVFLHGLGCLIYRSIIHYHRSQVKATAYLDARSSAVPLILGLFAAADLTFHMKKFRSHFLLLATAFGVLNSATADAMGGTIIFAMTGHLSKIFQGTSDWLFTGSFHPSTSMSARILTFFTFGVVLGATLNGTGLLQATITSPFTIIGILAVFLMQLYDRPLPMMLHALVNTRRNKRIDISINNWWSQNSLW